MSIDLHSLMAPYALHALDPHERSRFEAHLDQCVDCQAELAGFMATAARLGEAETHAPPADLRDRLMSAVATTPQERPIVTSLAEHRGLRRTLPRLAMAAAFLVGTVGVGGYVVERGQASDEHNRNVAISSVLTADDAATISKSFPSGGNVRLISSDDTDSAVIFAKDLHSPGKGKVYQVWLVGGSGPVSQGTFIKNGQMVMKGVSKSMRVAVTVEPKGGSAQPTTAPVASINI